MQNGERWLIGQMAIFPIAPAAPSTVPGKYITSTRLPSPGQGLPPCVLDTGRCCSPGRSGPPDCARACMEDMTA